MIKKANKPLHILLCALLGGCGPLVELGDRAPAPQHFTLIFAGPSPQNLALPSIRLESLEAPAELEPNAIAVRVGAQEVRYLTRAQWADRPARLMRTLLSDYLKRRSTGLVLEPDQVDITPALRVMGKLVAFQAVAPTGSPAQRVVVGLDLVIVRKDPPKDAPAAIQAHFSAEQPSSSDRAEDLAAAFNSAANRVAEDAAHWIVRNSAP